MEDQDKLIAVVNKHLEEVRSILMMIAQENHELNARIVEARHALLPLSQQEKSVTDDEGSLKTYIN